MTRWTWSCLALALVVGAACGDDGGFTLIGDGGGGLDGACQRTTCNPLAPAGQQMCPTGQKCTAVILPAGTILCPDTVVMACVPDGTQALGAQCVWSAAGAGPGHDNCAAGLMCASDAVCRDICGFGNTPAEMCTGGLTCFRTPGRFEPAGGGEGAFGVCARPL